MRIRILELRLLIRLCVLFYPAENGVQFAVLQVKNSRLPATKNFKKLPHIWRTRLPMDSK